MEELFNLEHATRFPGPSVSKVSGRLAVDARRRPREAKPAMRAARGFPRQSPVTLPIAVATREIPGNLAFTHHIFAICEQRIYTPGVHLKPQDLVVAIKFAMAGAQTYDQLAVSLAISKSEAHAAVKRAKAAGLLLADRQPNRQGLLEFLLHGVRYAFPADRGRQVRGMLTAHAAPPLSAHIHRGTEPPPVWPDPKGTVRGESFSPLYPGAPTAARADLKLYHCLSLIDAIRGGRARERNLAAKMLTELLGG